MNPLGFLLAAGAVAAGVAFFAKSKDSDLEAQKERARQLEQQLLISQINAQQLQQQAQAPALAQPTHQGQTAGGSIASLIDGAVGLWSLLT